jgi:transposase InsO family protein
MTDQLGNIYYDPNNAGSLGGRRRLLDEAKKIGLDLTANDVQDWLREQYVYTLHHPVRRNFVRNKVIVASPHEQAQADLVDLQMFKKDNDGNGFLLTFINSFSKKAAAVPVKNKTAKLVRDALEKLLAENQVDSLFTDAGGEFKNKLVAALCKKMGVTQYFANNPDTKASICERFNRTLKQRMFRLMTHTGSRRYIDAIEDIVNGYNKSYHRSIGMSPDEVSDNNLQSVFNHMYGTPDINSMMARNFNDRQKFGVGNSVRVKYTLTPMDKSYYPMFGDQVFKVRRIVKGDSRYLYKLEDYRHKQLPRAFYAEELQLISPDTLYRIEKIIKRKGKKVLVKYLNYPEDANEWIDSSAICTVAGDGLAVHSKA